MLKFYHYYTQKGRAVEKHAWFVPPGPISFKASYKFLFNCPGTSIKEINIILFLQMGLISTKPVFGVSDKARLNPISSATETSKKIEISPVAS